MKARNIYIKLQKLKERRDQYTPEQYEVELIKLKEELVNGSRIDFDSSEEESKQIDGILGIG